MPQGRSLPKTPNVRLRLTTLAGALLVCEFTRGPRAGPPPALQGPQSWQQKWYSVPS